MGYVECVAQRVGHIQPWGAELAERAKKATSPGDFQAAALRRIDQWNQNGLNRDAVHLIWDCVRDALSDEIVIDKDGQPNLSREWLEDVRQRFGAHEWWQLVAAALASLDLGFPFKRYFLDPDAMFANLQAHQPTFVDGEFPLTAPPIRFQAFNPCGPHDQYIESGPGDYDAVDALADVFTEEARLSAWYHGWESSVLELWPSVRHLVYIHALQHPEPDGSVGVHTVREGVFLVKAFRECTQFKPTVAKAVYELFGATRVLDFSAGWGDRLLGALAVPAIKKYHAYDPNPALVDGHAAILKRWAGKRNFKVMCEPAEGVPMFSGKFDLVFTSPPFYDVEKYTTAPGQSIQGRHSLDAWLTEFLFPVLAKAWAALETGGLMVLHLNDGKGRCMCEPVVYFCIQSLERCEFKGLLGTKGVQSHAVRPMWIFEKVRGPNDPPTNTLLERHFPRLALRMAQVTIAELGPEDPPAVEPLLRNPDVMRWIANGRAWDSHKIGRFFETVAAEGNTGAHKHWTIRVDGRVCGLIRVRPVNYVDDGQPRLTVMIEPQYQGCGIGAKAARLVADQVGPLRAEVHPTNTVSTHMLVKAGFVEQPRIYIRGIEHMSFSHGE